MKYAINKDNETINIKNVSNGKSCNCICKCCGEPVMAKQGKVKDWHFAHVSKIDCKYSNNPAETDLHILAKEVIKKHKSIYMPSVYYETAKGDDVEILKRGVIEFDKIELEKRVDKFTPDIIAYKGSEKVWIEIAVTHFTEKNKIDYCKNNDITLIEIDISHVDRDITEESLHSSIVTNNPFKRILWSTKLFNKVNKYYAVDFDYYPDLIEYKTGLNKFFLGYPLTGETTIKAVEERIKVLERRAKAQSKKRLVSSVNYIKNQIHDIDHLVNWWRNEQHHRKMKNGTPIYPHPDLANYVKAKGFTLDCRELEEDELQKIREFLGVFNMEDYKKLLEDYGEYVDHLMNLNKKSYEL